MTPFRGEGKNNKSMIRKEQKIFFETFGFLVLKRVFSPPEMQKITEAFDQVMAEARAADSGGDEPSPLTTKFVIDPGFIERHKTLKKIADDPRIHGTVEGLLGAGAYYAGSDGALCVGDTNWHPDQGWDPSIPEGRLDPNLTERSGHYYPGIKVAIYLEALLAGQGCLSVVPGSIHSPFHERLWSLHCDIPDRGKHLIQGDRINQFGVNPSEVPCFAIESHPGDVVFFSHQIWHASFGGDPGRRMIALAFKEAATNEQRRAYKARHEQQYRNVESRDS